MKKITKEELLNLATLSKLHLHEEEIPSLLEHIESILSYSLCVKNIAKEGEPVEDIERNVNVLRDDQAVAADSSAILAQAPEREENFFVVPVIIEK